MPAKKEKVSGKEEVLAYLQKLEHPFKAEIEAVRNIILNANPKIQERIKWNVPSFYYQIDLAAFHPRETKKVHVVFVFPPGKMVNESNGLLEGDYKDRRMAYFYSMDDVLAKKATLEKVVNDWVRLVDEA